MQPLNFLLALAATAANLVSALPSPADSSISGSKTLVKRSFLATCKDLSLNGVGLIAYCKNTHPETGGWTVNTLDLNGCIVNNNGVLQWRRNGGFGPSCDNIAWNVNGDGQMTARCRSGGGGTINTGIYLDERIHNANGRIWCEV